MPVGAPDSPAGFTPLALQPGWVLERYFGWQPVTEQPGLKLISRRRGPLATYLLTVDGRGRPDITATLESAHLLRPTALVWVCDLDADAPPRPEWASAGWTPVSEGRWFGAGTFVVDLALEQEQLLGRISARERTKLRQAERNGLTTETTACPSEADLATLADLYRKMAQERGLGYPTLELLARMASDGALMLARCQDADGRLLVANAAYCAHGQGYFLYGARARAAPPGAGPLAQWAIIRALKAAGLRYYDLGLVASTADTDGRYRFKRALGGVYVPFGHEYRHIPAWLRAPYRLFHAGRERVRRVRFGRAGD